MSKFKVGDKVCCTGTSKLQKNACNKSDFISKTFTIRSINPNKSTNYSITPYGLDQWCIFYEDELELISDRHELHITSDGTTTTAVYKLNGKVEKTAKAVCCPSDTYNFNTGAELAINRVLYGTDYNPKDAAFKEPIQSAPKQEDKPEFAVGDLAKVVSNTVSHRFPIGEIVRIRALGSSGKVEKAEYLDKHDWWVIPESNIEPYTEPERPKEPIVLYCTKEWRGGYGLAGGKIYETDSNFHIIFDNGSKSSYKFDEEIPDCWKEHLIKAEKRPAKVGETMLATRDSIFSDRLNGKLRYAKGDLLKCTKLPSGRPWECEAVCYNDTCEIIEHENYLVLPDYHPEPEIEPEPVYYSGKIVCTESNENWWLAGKPYEVVDGVIYDELHDHRNRLLSLEDLNSRVKFTAKFIPYLGEA